MSKFRKHNKDKQPSVSTAALPDIVFMLLFFFMVGAQLVSENYQKYIEIERAEATHLELLKDDHVSYYYVGRAKAGVQSLDGGSHLILANDKPISVEELPQYARSTQDNAGIYAKKVVAQFTIDGKTTAEYETKIKKMLSEAEQLNLSFTGVEKDFGPGVN